MASALPSMVRPIQNILVIDDNEDLLSLLQLWLQRLGFKVFTANGGAKALDIAAREPVDVVVVDYKMPEMNGEEVALAIRRIKPSLPILMYSGALEELPSRVLELVDEFVSKEEPFSNLLYHIQNLGFTRQRRKRAFLRYAVQLPFLVIYDEFPGSAVFYGESTDMSEGGIGGTLDQQLEIAVKGNVVIRITLSSDVALTTRASVRHRIGRRYGFQFLDLNLAQLQMLRTSLAQRMH